MEKNLNLKKYLSGQGIIEYLIVVAVVIVILLLIIGVVFNSFASTSDIVVAQKSTWSSFQPFAITDWSVNKDNYFQIVIENKKDSKLTFNQVKIGNYIDNQTRFDLGPGEKKILTSNSKISDCLVENSKNIIITVPMGDISIGYASLSGISRIQTGISAITFECN
ncbi:MAG: hypothetical protein PHQ98_02425 [Candidatus ainarchaeum sp.]|nr:hypothetical protein [Candidatus ainarchaeum sp.]